MANTYLTRSLSSTSTSWTFSAWVKRGSNLGVTNYFISWGNSGTDATGIGFNTSDKFQYYSEDNPSNINAVSNGVYRDTSGWYNFVCSCNAGAITLYTNGETVGSTTGGNALDTSTMAIGKWVTSAYYHDGSMSHVNFIDGTAYDATAFGQYDANGVWTIKTSPSVIYGNNGFFILKNGNSVTDQSGEGNDFTVAGGTLTKTESSPSNVFATLNPLHIQGTTSRSITYGNTRFYSTTTAWGSALSTLGFSSGKFYVEAKILTLNSSTGYGAIGIQDINAFGSSGNTNPNLCENASSAGLTTDYRVGQSAIRSGAITVSSNVGTFSNNDIIGMAIDMDNKALYIHKNGTYYQIGGVTGVPTSGASKTGAITIPTSVETCAIGLGGYTSNADSCYNFGNGYFLSTAVSSAGTNASGIGIFEYDVPTGYTALSTKGLNL